MVNFQHLMSVPTSVTSLERESPHKSEPVLETSQGREVLESALSELERTRELVCRKLETLGVTSGDMHSDPGHRYTPWQDEWQRSLTRSFRPLLESTPGDAVGGIDRAKGGRKVNFSDIPMDRDDILSQYSLGEYSALPQAGRATTNDGMSGAGLRHGGEPEWPREGQPGQPGLTQSDFRELPRYDPSLHATFGTDDTSRYLTKIPLRKFKGDKRDFDSWWAAFMSCIDTAHIKDEIKLLKLHDCLEGEPLKAISGLGFSGYAYKIAKERLVSKYGGERRALTLQWFDLNSFPKVPDNNAEELERFAELLDKLVVTLHDQGQQGELGGGTLYLNLQQKLSDALLNRYQRWLYESRRFGNVNELRAFINQEAAFMMATTETLRGLEPNRRRQNQNRQSDRQARTLTGQAAPVKKDENQRLCRVCNEGHAVSSCDVFKKLSIDQRWSQAKSLRLCFRCLGYHTSDKCRRKARCGVDNCERRHNQLLHGSSRQTDSGQQGNPAKMPLQEQEKLAPKPPPLAPGSEQHVEKPASESKKEATSMMLDLAPKQQVMLRTVPVVLYNGSRQITVNALLDDASNVSYVTEHVAGQLRLTGETEELGVNVIDNNQAVVKSRLVTCMLASTSGETTRLFSAHTVKSVSARLTAVSFSQHQHKWNHLREIPFPEMHGKRVDVLIGADHIELLQSYQEVAGEIGEPVARLTPLGWTCVGIISASPANTFTCLTFHSDGGALGETMRRFWEYEEPEPAQLVRPEDKVAVKVVEDTIQYKEKRYTVGLPWRNAQRPQSNNYPDARKRLISTERKLSKDPTLAEAYQKVFTDYLNKGYVHAVVTKTPRDDIAWYLPHFPVVRRDKETTKVRVVYDASARSRGLSLNDLLHAGPKLQQCLITVLLRFRRYPVALICDIKEMYMQVALIEKDQPYVRFLWRDMNMDSEPKVYQFERVVFGVSSSPFLAQYVARLNAEEHKDELPRAADTALNSTFMDDSLDSHKDTAAGKEAYTELLALWGKISMEPRKWITNDPELLSLIPATERAQQYDLARHEAPEMKTLGLGYNPVADEFFIVIGGLKLLQPVTKRGFLKTLSTVFDPLGLVAPVITKGKVLMQQTWTAGVEWDHELPESLATTIIMWVKELPRLTEFRVRCVLITQPDKSSLQLHVFTDASEVAYGAVVYIREVTAEGVCVNLVCAKSKVAPLQAVSIPRLELMAAVLGAKLGEKVKMTLGMDAAACHYWSDSMDVLHWIRGHSRQFKTFIANRVGAIQRLSAPEQWQYVNTADNPADSVSRGQDASEFLHDGKWLVGPAWLGNAQDQWPAVEIHSRNETLAFYGVSMDTRRSENATRKGVEKTRLAPNRFSNWKRFLRVWCYVRRAIDGFRGCLQSSKRHLCTEEIHAAECEILHMAQDDYAAERGQLKVKGHVNPTSKLASLNPCLDENGIMRATSRLINADFLPWDTRYPIILDKGNWVTRLIVGYYHEQGCHGGTNATLAGLSARFWIIGAREAIRSWEKECVRCLKAKGKPLQPMMAPLVRPRWEMTSRPFALTSIDFAGPFLTRQGRGRAQQKRYLCIFVCMSVRAVHMEIVMSLSTAGFLNALGRMAARRGTPREITTDNGTNFVGGRRELCDLHNALEPDLLQDETAYNGIQWHFNPPAAPHFNGVHEVMVRSAKRALRMVITPGETTDEELMTAFCEVENILNCRPLTYQSASGADLLPLTPQNFLVGHMPAPYVPPNIDTDDGDTLRNRWRHVQDLVARWWRRWLREWLTSMSPRSKWYGKMKDLEVGDVVLVLETDLPRNQWKMGRVTEVVTGRDGHVRVACVRTVKGEIKRPVVKLIPLTK